MNMFNKFLGLAICGSISFSILAQHDEVAPRSEKIEISKYLKSNSPCEIVNKKSISVEVHYYSDIYAVHRRLGNKRMILQDGHYVPNVSLVPCVSVLGSHILVDFSRMPNVSVDDIYKNYKRAITEERDCILLGEHPGTIHLHFPDYDTTGMTWHKHLFPYREAGIILIACEKEKDKAQKILDMYKSVMKKIAHEESGIHYQETRYKYGKIVGWRAITGEEEVFCTRPNEPSITLQRINRTPLLSQLKNFVWNEKFLYAMGGLSAVYLGYEYLNQR